MDQVSLPGRLALFETCKQFSGQMRSLPLLPKQTLMEVTHTVTVKQGPCPRRSSEGPCLSLIHLRAPLCVHQGDESELTIRLRVYPFSNLRTHLGRLRDRLRELDHRMLKGAAKPLHTLYMLADSVEGMNVRQLLKDFPKNLCNISVFCIEGAMLTKLPTQIFGQLTTLKLKRVHPFSIEDIGEAALSRLQSLELILCGHISSTQGLASATNLEHLGISDTYLTVPCWDCIRQLTWLTSLRLLDVFIPPDVLTVFTHLESLSIAPAPLGWLQPVPADLHMELLQLSRTAHGLRYLGIRCCRYFLFPADWNLLTSVSLPHWIYTIPDLPSITRLTLRPTKCRTLEQLHFHSMPFGRTSPNLSHLCAPYHILRLAAWSHALIEMVWTPSLLELRDSEHAALLNIARGDSWPLLRRVLVLLGDGMQVDIWQGLRNAWLLEALASRDVCAITHVTVQQGESHGAVEALAPMPKLCCVTLIGMLVGITELHTLLRRSRSVRVLELVGIKGVSRMEIRGLKAVAKRRGIVVSCLRPDEMDSGSAEVFASDF